MLATDVLSSVKYLSTKIELYVNHLFIDRRKSRGLNTEASESKNSQPHMQIRTACSSAPVRPSKEAS